MRFSYEGDVKKAYGFTGRVQQELDRLQARMSSAGLDRGTWHSALDDTSYGYGYILPGGLRVAHVVTVPGVGPVEEFPNFTETKTPDFLSGYVGNGLVENAVPASDDAEAIPALLRSFTPSTETARVHAEELTRLPKVERLAVYPWVAFDTVGLGDMAFAQTQTLYATSYTGRMRKVVQALFGFGKQPNGEGDVSIFDAIDPTFEETEGDDPAQTKYQIDVQTNGLQVRYDYRFMRTHGITVAADGKLWVVEIGMNRGVIAMQLPLHENTTTDEFRDLVLEADRQEALVLLDEFGGFPTGEAFPNTPDSLDANIRAGRVLRLKTASDLAAFYSHTGYSSAMGWAFNDDGSEAHNTAWRFGDEGVQRGVHYAISLRIGDFIEKTPPARQQDVIDIAAEVQSQRQEQYDAVVFKAGRLTDEQIDFAWGRPNMTPLQMFDAIDAIEMEPCAAASAGVSLCSEGKIYWPTPLGQPQIKFPEPILGGLLSHDMRPSSIQSTKPFCDVVMHVFFSGMDLKYVKYYNDNSVWRAGWTWEGDDEFDIDYTPIGDFYRAYVYGPVVVPPGFYSTEFDPREELPASKFEWFYHRRKVGPTEPWAFSHAIAYPPSQYCEPRPDTGQTATATTVYSTCWFTTDYDFHYATVRSIESAAVVPFYDREAYYFAVLRKKTGGAVQYARGYQGINSPHITWRTEGDDWLLDDMSFYPGGGPGFEIYDYQKDFADAGPIGGVGGDIRDYRMTNNDDPYHQYNWPPGYESTVVYVPATGSLETRLITSTRYDNILIETESRTGDEEVGLWIPLWFLPSPDEFGDYQFIGETSNSLGDVECVVYGIHLLNGKRDVVGSPAEAKDSTYYPCFIGADNG